ncbi:hypothetical protein A1QO_04005 [Vibrio genomosp. F10 str. ZF-129]|uniref:Uncharacterized protein n=1 Tax=Vibrio genomosp. F10 str. ZF-129 TaxID=1187848 RepID=A0A1E5BIK0_9VIBR|nr:hypothetical protein [Vibrio genomosp. F10]OEE37275.1 hypothetical protein A1QO_04005 [Vibrio genomosp. F10 str. ZF-129]
MKLTFTDHTNTTHEIDVENTINTAAISQSIVDELSSSYSLPTFWEEHNYTIESDEDLRWVMNAANTIQRQLVEKGPFTQTDYLEGLSSHLTQHFYEKIKTLDISPIDLCVNAIVMSMEDQFEESVLDELRTALFDKISLLDKSSVFDVIDGVAELFYSPGVDLNNGSAEDTELRFEVSGSKGLINVNGIHSLLKLANLASVDFISYLERAYEDHPCVDYLNENPFQPDAQLPVTFSAELLSIVIDNACYGGVSALTTYVNVTDFILRDINKPVRLTKGAIGVEDVIWGSGHAETISDYVQLSTTDVDWCVLPKAMERDSVYGYSIHRLTSDIQQSEFNAIAA